MSDTTETEAIAALAATNAIIPTVELGDNGVWLYRDGHGNVHEIDPQVTDAHPRRPTGTFTHDTESSFTAYVNAYVEGHGERCAVYASVDNMQLRAVLNEHETGEWPTMAGWRDWSALLPLLPGPSWKAWTDIDGKWLQQAAAIDFLEDRITDVESPDSTKLLEIVSELSGTKSITFRNAQRLSDGAQRINYEEEVTGAGGRAGELDVPERLVLVLEPIRSVNLYRVNARLRWRITETALQVMVKLERTEDVLEKAFEELTDRVAGAVDPVPLYRGDAY